MYTLHTVVGGVAQWLGRRSLAGGLSVIYDRSMLDMWPLRGESVRYGSTKTRPTQPSIPSGSTNAR